MTLILFQFTQRITSIGLCWCWLFLLSDVHLYGTMFCKLEYTVFVIHCLGIKVFLLTFPCYCFMTKNFECQSWYFGKFVWEIKLVVTKPYHLWVFGQKITVSEYFLNFYYFIYWISKYWRMLPYFSKLFFLN